jgi:D-beta-D-heptose 7-phosphate kinase/D-beta-D-heptose 1-phosphate adenosyltransferase
VRAANVVVISDYAKGWVSEYLCYHAILLAHNEHPKGPIPVIVDPKGDDWNKYAGADVICPNETELEAFKRSRATVQPFFPVMVQKRGRFGLLVVKESDGLKREQAIPSRSRAVFDVTGAGDTVVAVLAACIGAGIDLYDAAELANVAAGVVVAKLGTSVATCDEILEACK